MAALYASATELPFIVATCVLGGFALWGWRRTGATGALLIIVGAGVRLLGQAAYVVHLARMYTVGPSSMVRETMIFGAVQSVGGIIADILFIVGLALILRRLPAAKR